MRYFLSFIVLFGMISLYGQGSQTRPVMVKDSPAGSDISEEVVKKFCAKLSGFLKSDSDNFKKSTYINYHYMHRNLSEWLNYQFLELDSGIDRNWFKKLDQFIIFFHNTKRANDFSSDAADSEAKALCKKRFDVGVANFKKFMEVKPPKPPPQRLEVLKRQKQEYLRAKKVEERKKNSGGKTRKLFDDEG